MDKMLQPTDIVGATFWLISLAMIAATAFFFLERKRVADRWKAAVTVAGSDTEAAEATRSIIVSNWFTELRERMGGN